MYHQDWEDGNEEVINDETADEQWSDNVYYCDDCEKPLTATEGNSCRECEEEYDRRNPHPLDIAAREDAEDRSEGIYRPWAGEF